MWALVDYQTSLFSLGKHLASGLSCAGVGVGGRGGRQKAVISEAINGVFLEFIIPVCRWSRFQLSADNNWFRFISHCDWSRNHAPLCQPIRCKTKTDHDLVALYCDFRL